jgi:hypothetical protein
MSDRALRAGCRAEQQRAAAGRGGTGTCGGEEKGA